MPRRVLVALAIVATLLMLPNDGRAQEPPAPWRGQTVPDQRPKPFSNFSLSAERLRDSVVAVAHRQLGVRYRYGGESAKRGFDCSGLVRQILGKLDVVLPRTAAAQARVGAAIPKDTSLLLPGDVLTFGHGKRIDHVGVYIGDGRFVHASGSRGRVTESALPVGKLAGWWKGARRFLAVSEARDTTGGATTP